MGPCQLKVSKCVQANVVQSRLSAESLTGIVAPGSGNLKYSAAFGEISAFRGTKVRGDGGTQATRKLYPT